MDRTRSVSRPVCARRSSISVVTRLLAPARSTKERAICVTAKIRWRRLVLPVMRAPPVARLRPWVVSPEGSRGTKARTTEATIARPAPTHSMLESTVRSNARTEKREA